MTESEWRASADPQQLLRFLRDRGASDRKLRLFAVACCRRISHLMTDTRSWRAVEVAESFADCVTTANDSELGAALLGACETPSWVRGVLNHPTFAARYTAWPVPCGDQTTFMYAATHAAQDAVEAVMKSGGSPASEDAAQAALVRCIFSPFRTPGFPASWRSATAGSLARAIYESRDFSAMPILADALQDEGCDDEAVLSHCRGPNVHVRGCHVIDLILGRS